MLADRRAESYRRACVERGSIVFVPVTEGSFLGVAVANERGYHPVPEGWACYANMDAAQQHANHLNTEVLGLTGEQVAMIIISTMGGVRYHEPT